MGTEIDEIWYRRFRRNGFFSRGKGEYWIENDRFYFRRLLTRQPLIIPFSAVRAFKLGSWHAGQWALTKRIIKFIWNKDARLLSSGFILTPTADEAAVCRDLLQNLIG